MTLHDLLESVLAAVEKAAEFGQATSDIQVTLQIDDAAGNSIWGDQHVELHYDGNGMASGCVLTVNKTGNC